MKRWRGRLGVAVLAFGSLLAACSGGDGSGQGGGGAVPVQQASPPVPLPAQVIPVPLVARQETDYSCGDVATLAVLRYWHWDLYGSVPEDSLYAPLHTTPSEGTDPQPIADYINTVAGMSASYQTNVEESDFTAAVDCGEPPIVDLQAWSSPVLSDYSTDVSDGHYAVLIGYDADNYYFMDAALSDHYAYLPRGEIESRWHDVVQGVPASHMVVFVQGSGPVHAESRFRR